MRTLSSSHPLIIIITTSDFTRVGTLLFFSPATARSRRGSGGERSTCPAHADPAERMTTMTGQELADDDDDDDGWVHVPA